MRCMMPRPRLYRNVSLETETFETKTTTLIITHVKVYDTLLSRVSHVIIMIVNSSSYVQFSVQDQLQQTRAAVDITQL